MCSHAQRSENESDLRAWFGLENYSFFNTLITRTLMEKKFEVLGFQNIWVNSNSIQIKLKISLIRISWEFELSKLEL